MFGIAKTDNFEEVQTRGGIPEIMEVILYADARSAPFTSIISEKLKAKTDRETFFNIWRFARKNVNYIEDKPGHEVVKSPGNLLSERSGDCKSFSVLVGSILQNLGYNYHYRLIWERPWVPGVAHVYVMAETRDGNFIAIDPVNPDFAAEPFYYFFAKRDYFPERAQVGKRLGGGVVKFIAAAAVLAILLKPKGND